MSHLATLQVCCLKWLAFTHRRQKTQTTIVSLHVLGFRRRTAASYKTSFTCWSETWALTNSMLLLITIFLVISGTSKSLPCHKYAIFYREDFWLNWIVLNEQQSAKTWKRISDNLNFHFIATVSPLVCRVRYQLCTTINKLFVCHRFIVL